MTEPDVARLVELIIARGLADPPRIRRLVDEHARRRAAGQAVRPLPDVLCAVGVVTPAQLARLAEELGAGRGRPASPPAVSGWEARGEPGRAPAASDIDTTLLGPGARIGPYRIEAVLGRGGMGVVYRAQDERLKRSVALKTIWGAVDDEAIVRLRREARAAARLRHRNIVSVHEVESYDGRLVVALELVEGQSLARRVSEDGPYEPRAAASLVLSLARALAVAHDERIVHRDIKPANVLLDADGEPHLTDFGLARDDKASGGVLTQTGDALGTPAYMSPEQALADRDAVGPTSDLYSLGALLFQLLTGRPPFLERSALATLNSVLERDPPTATSVRRERGLPPAPKQLETILAILLRKKPEERYPSADALARDLERFLAGDAIRARPAPGEGPTSPAPAPGAIAIAVAVLAIVALVVAGAVVATRGAAVDPGRAALVADARTRAETSLVAFRAGRDTLRAAEGVPASAAQRSHLVSLARDAFEATGELLALAGPDDDAARRARFEASIGLAAAAREDGQWPLAERALAVADDASIDAAIVETARRELAGARDRGSGSSPPAERPDDPGPAPEPVESGGVGEDGARAEGDPRIGDLVARAEAAIAGGDPGAALALADEALAIASTHLEARVTRSEALLRLGRVDEALGELDRVVEQHPDARMGWYCRAFVKVQRGDVRGGIADMTRAIERPGSEANDWSNRAAFHLMIGAFRETIADARRSVTIDPRLHRGWSNLAQGHLGLEQFGDARAAAVRATEIAPSDPQVWMIRALVDDRIRDYPAAEASATRTLELDPSAFHAWRIRGEARNALGRWAEAIGDLDRAIAIDPGHGLSHHNRGTAKSQLGRHEEALLDYERAIALAPRDANVWNGRGFARARAGDPAAAIDDYDQAIAIDPRFFLAHCNRGIALGELHRVEDAVASLERGLALMPAGHGNVEPVKAMIADLRARLDR